MTILYAKTPNKNIVVSTQAVPVADLSEEYLKNMAQYGWVWDKRKHFFAPKSEPLALLVRLWDLAGEKPIEPTKVYTHEDAI